ncbi:hypothetical protein CDSM653_02348 [Caldanaerobacter subterraneus subsp. pacificus DSM 12653]|uniref:Uncharacterized protein n=1 Tax=Caldanaerobacter subterraneus subsp. pacificus DSM 12653 TaxID=391606 RepID=A0A0F5PJ76_9THEO|nr:hypothetical protein CDSM653_02348 [Caldanaerobacter subterraneus subsp. pacificus DSM 12653]
MLDEFREALKFLAYLRGIETTARSAKTRVATRFLAYLRGIETVIMDELHAVRDRVFSLPKRD